MADDKQNTGRGGAGASDDLDSAGKPAGPSIGKSEVLSQSDLDAILAQAGAADPGPKAAASSVRPMDLPDLKSSAPVRKDSLNLLMDIALNVKIELGRTSMYIEDILKLAPGSVVELDKLAGDPVDILVNDRPIAKGEVLILNDNFCVRIGEIITPEERLKAKKI